MSHQLTTTKESTPLPPININQARLEAQFDLEPIDVDLGVKKYRKSSPGWEERAALRAEAHFVHADPE